MWHRDHRILMALVVVGLLVLACREVTAGDAAGSEPARVEPIEGTDQSRVVMTKGAARRLDIQTAAVQEAGRGRATVVPYGAVFYATNGETWTYVMPEPLTFVRRAIRVDYFVADLAVLSDGPPPGTTVVTVGAAELFGIETGVGH